MKQRCQQAIIVLGERVVELREPVVRGGRDIFGSVQHFSPNPSVCAVVSDARNPSLLFTQEIANFLQQYRQRGILLKRNVIFSR